MLNYREIANQSLLETLRSLSECISGTEEHTKMILLIFYK